MQFWKVIETACDRPLSVDVSAPRLEAQLREMPVADVEAFCREFDRLMDGAYHWDLWGVAYLANGGCGDDAFMDFRSSLIALGEKTYQAAVSDPESLIELPPEELRELFEEGMLYCGPKAYESLTGAALKRASETKTEPDGLPWEETRESLMARFPRVWSLHGWEERETSEVGEPKRRPWWKFW